MVKPQNGVIIMMFCILVEKEGNGGESVSLILRNKHEAEEDDKADLRSTLVRCVKSVLTLLSQGSPT